MMCFRIIILIKHIFQFWWNHLFKVNSNVDRYLAGREYTFGPLVSNVTINFLKIQSLTSKGHLKGQS